MKKLIIVMATLALASFNSFKIFASEPQSKSVLSKITSLPSYAARGLSSLICCKSLCKKSPQPAKLKTITAFQAVKKITDCYVYSWQDAQNYLERNAQHVANIKQVIQTIGNTEITKVCQEIFPQVSDHNQSTLRDYSLRLFFLHEFFKRNKNQRTFCGPNAHLAFEFVDAVEKSTWTTQIKDND
jgi:hypothetical protein